MTLHRTTLLVAALTLCALAVGCAQQVPAINRVQPYALDKTWFVGKDLQDAKDDPEFWSRATLIDVGYGAAQDGLFTSTYAQPTTRIKWQVTEKFLIGRLAYERINNSDGKGVGQSTENGIIVCSYPITSHFDIKKDYNPTTGEELNVVGENSSDRPWYDRAYMHVDFSKNLNTDSYDFDTLSMMGVYGGISYEATAYEITDPSDENAPFFTEDGSYFDVTNKAFARPGMIDLSYLGWGIKQFPSCYLDADFSGGSAPTGSCNPVELTIRQSFRRVANSDFEPKEWDGHRFQAYGVFTTERRGYARDYGMTDTNWHRLAEIYDIWNRSHYYDNQADMTGQVPCFTTDTTPYGADPHRDEDADGTEDECAPVKDKTGLGGSRCDTFKQRCTLPYRLRTPKPVIWYSTNGNNPDYFQPTEDAAHEWDVAMRGAVRAAMYSECTNALDKGKDAVADPATCAKNFPIYFGQQEENQDAIQLAMEVDDCRHGIAHKDLGQDDAKCKALADTVGAKRSVGPAVIDIAKMPEMVVLCHSPVEATDPLVCGDPNQRLPHGISSVDCFNAQKGGDRPTIDTCNKAIHARRGDLRFHQVNNLVEPQVPSPWGIMVDAKDPLTGETVSASINVWTYINDLWSQGVVDQARYINGEIPVEDITNGKYIQNWSAAAQAASMGGTLPQLTAEQAEGRRGDVGDHMSAAQADQFAGAHPEAITAGTELKDKLRTVQANSAATSTSAPTYNARMQAAAGTEFEAALVTPAIQQLMGVVGLPLTGSIMDLASPLRGGNPALQRQVRQMRENALADRGACVMEMADAPLSIAGLADVLQTKFGGFDATSEVKTQNARAESMRKYLARRVHYAVIIHEMGHSMGLRHNFISSADAWGFRPQYWQLRTSDGTVTTPCTQLAADGAKCVGPRYFDPVTKEERDNLIWMWMQSSVMDYAGETTQDMLGLGAYDFAAVRMFYGETVAVHTNEAYNVGTKLGNGMLAQMDDFGGILGLTPQVYDTKAKQYTDIHYSQLQSNYSLITDCAAVADPIAFKPGRWDDTRDGAFHPTLDGLIVNVGGNYTRCKMQQVDYVPWQSLRSPTAKEYGTGTYRGNVAIDAQGRTRLPYGFASDNWADLGNASVYRHDNGADTYEIFNFMATQQEVMHIFDNYRRNRSTFSVRSAANRSLSRYNEKMRDGAKGLGLYRNIYKQFAAQLGLTGESMWAYAAQKFFPDPVLSAGMVFDYFTHQTGRPEDGPHYLDDTGKVLLSTGSSMSSQVKTVVNVPNGATGFFGKVTFNGRPVENALATDQGDYNSQFTMNAGSYYDKMYTTMLLTESVDNFISSSLQDFTDARYRSVSIADLFPEGYRRFIGNMLTNDSFIKGARVATDKNGKVLADKQLFPTSPIGWTTWYGATPTSCFPGDGTTICSSLSKADQTVFGSKTPANTLAIDPQVGWEQQKFLIAWTLLYLPENQQQDWLNMFKVWEMGSDSDPQLGNNRIEFHHPDGRTWIARSFGREDIFGKTVQKGIAARVLEYANELLNQAYDCTAVDVDNDSVVDWYQPKLNPSNGQPLVKFDAGVVGVDPATGGNITSFPNCTDTDFSACTCDMNRACMALKEYISVPTFMRSAIAAYNLGNPHGKGIY